MYPVAQDLLNGGQVVEVTYQPPPGVGGIAWVAKHYTSRWYYNDAMPPLESDARMEYPTHTDLLIWLN